MAFGRPHARGGVSRCKDCLGAGDGSSPRTWGCFQGLRYRVGALYGRPHARGGVSDYGVFWKVAHRSSPRTWGCFWPAFVVYQRLKVVPTHVGVFLAISNTDLQLLRRPHARGGVSCDCTRSSSSEVSSPRTWGCFRMLTLNNGTTHVVPTHVGVFPKPGGLLSSIVRRPHARGGVSLPSLYLRDRLLSSPRTWGCFSQHPRHQ